MATEKKQESRLERLKRQRDEYRQLEEQAKAQAFSYRGAAQALEREIAEENGTGEQEKSEES
jgi:hypothetical protein